MFLGYDYVKKGIIVSEEVNVLRRTICSERSNVPRKIIGTDGADVPKKTIASEGDKVMKGTTVPEKDHRFGSDKITLTTVLKSSILLKYDLRQGYVGVSWNVFRYNLKLGSSSYKKKKTTGN